MFTAFNVRSLWISWRTLGRIPPFYSHHGSNPLATGTQTVHMPKKADSLEDPGQRRKARTIPGSTLRKCGHRPRIIIQLIKSGGMGYFRRGQTEVGRGIRHCPTS
jgi:hypothetical protein